MALQRRAPSNCVYGCVHRGKPGLDAETAKILFLFNYQLFKWWAHQGSTWDPMIKSQLLYQLSWALASLY